MSDYGAGPGLAVHTLHFTECASRLPAVLILPVAACSGGFPAQPRNPAWFWNRRVGRSAIGPDNGPGAGGVVVERMAARPAKAKNGWRRSSRCPEGAGGEGGDNAARGARPRGRKGASRGVRSPFPRLHPRPGCASAPSVSRKFSKIALASPSEFPYSTSSHGGVAQLGERLTGSQEVRGSIPLVSTRALNEAPTQVGAFFHIGTQGQRRHHDPPGRQDRKKLRRARPL